MRLQVPIEIIISALITPMMGAISALFWLLHRERGARLKDRDMRIEQQEKIIAFYRDQLLPAQERTTHAVEKVGAILEHVNFPKGGRDESR